MRVEAATPAGKLLPASLMMPRGFSPLLLVMAVVVSPAYAQSSDFSALRDSLNRLSDVHEVRHLEQHRRPARNAPAAQHVQHGLIALRLYQLTDDATVSKRAAGSFEAAVSRDPQLGWAQFGLGLSLVSSPSARPLNEGGNVGRFVVDDVTRRFFGRDARSRARQAFNAALQTVPPVNRAARELAALALDAQNPDWLKEAERALRDLDGRQQALPEELAMLSLVQAALGDLDSAITLADRALEAGPARADARKAAGVARLRVAGREQEGARFYFDGLRVANADELDSYYDDVLPIAEPKEQSRWQSGNLETRRELLLKFWNQRAALGGVTVAERVAEHYRRLPYAEQHYRRLALYGAPERNELRWQPAHKRSRFDDRGEIYLRHGRPDEVIGSMTASENDSQSWLYWLPDGSFRMFHFVYARGGYSLPYYIPCADDFLRDRVQHDSRLGLLSMRKCDPGSTALYSASLRELYYEALESDSHYPRFTRDLPFFYDLYTFRGQPGRTAVVAAFAVPATKLEKNVDDQGVHYRFDVSLILADTALGTVSRTDDSATVRLSRALSDEDLLRTHLEVQVPPSGSTLQRVIMTDPTAPGIGQLYGGPFPIPDYSGRELMISDIALGQTNRSAGWRRGEVMLTLVPTSQFPTGSFDLYYEIYNLPAGRAYTTEVVIERLDKGAGDHLRNLFGASSDLRIKFSGESTARPDGTLPELRRIEELLRKGRYRMTVIVRDNETGQTARRSRLFRVP
ncbi:MAG: GWxTD domain-containing protein [Longimicrobiales bacterium]